METLTKAEKLVFNELKTGKTNQQIADTIFISEKTVKFHIGNIYKKLGVKTRAEALVTLSGDIHFQKKQMENGSMNETKEMDALPIPNSQRNEITIRDSNQKVATQQDKINFIDDKFKIGESISQLHHMMKTVTAKEITPSTVNAACNCVARINETVDTAIKAARFLSEK